MKSGWFYVMAVTCQCEKKLGRVLGKGWGVAQVTRLEAGTYGDRRDFFSLSE